MRSARRPGCRASRTPGRFPCWPVGGQQRGVLALRLGAVRRRLPPAAVARRAVAAAGRAGPRRVLDGGSQPVLGIGLTAELARFRRLRSSADRFVLAGRPGRRTPPAAAVHRRRLVALHRLTALSQLVAARARAPGGGSTWSAAAALLAIAGTWPGRCCASAAGSRSSCRPRSRSQPRHRSAPRHRPGAGRCRPARHGWSG